MFVNASGCHAADESAQSLIVVAWGLSLFNMSLQKYRKDCLMTKSCKSCVIKIFSAVCYLS